MMSSEREHDYHFGEFWFTFNARCSWSTEEGHPEETDLTMEDINPFAHPDVYLEDMGWKRTESDGVLCSHCAEQLKVRKS